MIGSCTINGIDISTLGMIVMRGSDNDLLAFPERREPPQNDWFEESGIDAYLAEPRFNTKRVVMKFFLSAPDGDSYLSRLNAFRDLLYGSAQTGYRALFLNELNHTYMLRLVDVSDYKHKGGLASMLRKTGEVTCVFEMDNPLSNIALDVLVPVSERTSLANVGLNGYDLSKFGIIVKDIYSTALRIGKPKPGLTRTFEHLNGAISDVGYVLKRTGRQIIVDCTMMASTREEFYANRNALFNNLTLSQAVVLSYAGKQSASCYYKSMQDFEKKKPFKNGVHVTFKLHLNEV